MHQFSPRHTTRRPICGGRQIFTDHGRLGIATRMLITAGRSMFPDDTTQHWHHAGAVANTHTL